jgi:HD superfamily phosphodiesterase
MQFENAYLFLIKKLEEELPTCLTYHNVQHTKDVVEGVRYLAKRENVSHNQYLLLSTAAAFHDVGFIEGYEEHERLSCKIAKTFLPGFDYTDKEIEQICELIMVTKPPQTPKNHLEEILCDADLLYLGTDRYARVAENLFQEFKAKGIVNNRRDWDEKQGRFLREHHFFTETAVREYAQKKAENCNNLSDPDFK